MTPRLLERYKKEVAPRLKDQFSYSSPMQIPNLVKVVVNIGVSEAKVDMKYMEASLSELATITGQHPMMKRARRSVAGFKVREGMPVACCVTLRSSKMWEFVDRLISAGLPRIKDFQGVTRRGFDGRGNYNLGLREQLLFPEIEYDKVIRMRGMNISFVTSASTDEEAFALLSEIGMPFNK
jgi:large subunit ribosomal protein L5